MCLAWEFIAAQIKDFEADKKIQLAMTMLDWNERTLTFPTETGEPAVCIRVDEPLLCSSLLPHERAISYTPDEVHIRDCFDRFFDMLVRFADFSEARLITTAELRPYLDYWIDLIAGDKPDWHTPELFILLKHYMKIYGFTKALLLIEKFGHSASVSDDALHRAVMTTLELRRAPEMI